MSKIVQQALEPAIRLELFPKSVIEVFITVLETDGLEACVAAGATAAGAALAHAGIELIGIVAACSAALVAGTVWLDPTLAESELADGVVVVSGLPALGTVTNLWQTGRLSAKNMIRAILGPNHPPQRTTTCPLCIMDAQEPIVSDFSFAFKRRSHSPSPHDCLAPATLYRAPSTSGSQSPPPSLSDATSSHGSPKDWNSLPWNPAYQIPDMNSVAHSFNWQWPQKQPDANFLPAVDPMSLTLGEAMSLASEPPFFNPSLPIDVGPQTAYSLLHSLNGLSHPLQPTQSLPQQPVVFSQPSVADFAGAPLPAN
ncbi:hypothetical protein FRB90_010582, partial [Tulasnella sp. 427]